MVDDRILLFQNMHMRCCALLLTVIALCFMVNAAFGQDGGVPGALLNYGMTPRTIAMGKAFTGLADDQEAAYYNPAGLVQLLSHNVKSSYLSLLGTSAGYLGYALPTRQFGSLGLSVMYQGSPDIVSYVPSGSEAGMYSFYQYCFLFSYAYQPIQILGLGVNVKSMISKIAQYGAVGVGADLGMFIFPRRSFTIGITCQNLLGPRLTYIDETEEVPLTFRGGVALKLYDGRAVIAVDVSKSVLDYTSLEPHVGFEFVPFYPLLTLRGGLDRNFISGGLGLQQDWNNFSAGIDYAVELHYASSYLAPTRHKVGMYLMFGGFRAYVEGSPKKFSPTPGRRENVAWMDLHYKTKRPIERWQLLIRNQYGEVVRTYSGWDAPPLRLSWDGLDDIGRIVADGKYYYEIIIIDEMGETISFHSFLSEVATLGPEGEIEFIPQD